MKQYEKYKPSGMEWLGDIPEHWEVKRFKDLAYSITGLTYSPDDITDENEGTLVLRSGNIQNSCLDFTNNVYVSCKINKTLYFKKGDILLCSRNGSANLVGKSAYIDQSYNYTWGAFMTVARSKMDKYLFYSLNSDLLKSNMGLFQTSTVNQLTAKMLDNMTFLKPPLSEQTTIANYLDTKTAAIDRKIELLTAKANKYKALRRSLINETVCRGLNPNAPLKDSSIEWIGMIPEHWDEYRMKDLGFLYSGLSGKAGDDFNQDENENENNCDFIPFTNIFNNDIINPEMMGKVVVFDNEKQNKVKRNDLFFLMSSEDYDGLGKSSLLNVDLKNTYLNSFCKGFRITRKKVLPAFLNYQLQSDTFRKIMQIEGKGFTRMNLKMEKVNDFTIFIPNSIEEQATIVKYLNERNAQIDTILNNISQQITKLTQLRKTLINDVVTGKIKVTED